MGAGHANAAKAISPGLVYDIVEESQCIAYLCGLGYTDDQVESIAHTRYSVDVSLPAGVRAEVLPSALEFGGLRGRRSFTVKLNWDAGKTTHAEGSLKWASATHVVRIPIVRCS